MAEYVPVATVAEIPEGGRKIVQVNSIPVALFHRSDGWYAIRNVCPHRGGPLGQGPLDGDLVTCPWHAWRFNITNGQNAMNPTAGVATYAVKVEGDQVLLDPEPRMPSGGTGPFGSLGLEKK